MSHNKGIPQQVVGKGKNIDYKRSFENFQLAHAVFHQSKMRLLDVNNWNRLCNKLSSDFTLTDNLGYPVNRTAQIGDYIKIDIPGPATSVGNGFDWVKIEKINSYSEPEKGFEYFMMQVRPAHYPNDKSPDIAHFFSDTGTSSFVIELNEKKVKASVLSRNELPNYKSQNIIDKLRNFVVGFAALLGMSNLQWKRLVKKLIVG